MIIPLVFQELIQTSWDNYYPTIDPPTENYTYSGITFSNKTMAQTAGNSYVFNCYFYDVTAEYGAAILYSSTEMHNQ